MAEVAFEIRPCCRDIGPGVSTIANAVGEQPQTGTGQVQRTEPIRRHRDRGMCHHEAGHAVVALAMGLPAKLVTVDGAPSFHPGDAVDPRGLTRAQSIALSLAGPIAERWADRLEYRSPDAEWQVYLRRMQSSRSGGACDLCRASLHAICHLGHRAQEADHIRLLRDVEAQTIRLVQHRAVWNAIRELAAELSYHGTISGHDTEAIARKFFSPGDFNVTATLVRKVQNERSPAPEEAR